MVQNDQILKKSEVKQKEEKNKGKVVYFREEGKRKQKRLRKTKNSEKLKRKEEKWEKVWYKKRGRDKWDKKADIKEEESKQTREK